jgi:hypothetical protein
MQAALTGPQYNLVGMFPKAIACLQFGSDNLKKVLRIIEAYLILDSIGIVKVCSVDTTRTNNRAMGKTFSADSMI